MLKRKERRFAVKSCDQQLIHGVLSYVGSKPLRLVIFVHGLTSCTEEAKFYNGARAFESAGFAAVRFELYGGRPKSRKLSETGISDHGADIRRLVNHFKRQGFKEVFLVGHSLGAPSILQAGGKDVSAIVFWDGTSETWVRKSLEKWRAHYESRLDSYVLDWGIEYIWGNKMYAECRQLQSYQQLFADLPLPVLVILAEKGVLLKDWRNFQKRHPALVELLVIKGAGHNFEELDTQAELLRHSVAWCRRRSRV